MRTKKGRRVTLSTGRKATLNGKMCKGKAKGRHQAEFRNRSGRKQVVCVRCTGTVKKRRSRAK